MTVNSKSKGSNWERRVSNIFSERFEKHTGIKNSFRRNIDSGSFFGSSNKHRIETYDTTHATFGDIIVPDKFLFSIEAKAYKLPFTVSSLIKQKISEIDLWIAQATQDSINSKKF